MPHQLEDKAKVRTLGPKKKKAPKLVIGDTKSAGPFVKEQTIELSNVGKRGTAKVGVTIGGREFKTTGSTTSVTTGMGGKRAGKGSRVHVSR